MLKYAFLILFCLTGCNYVDDVAEDAAEKAIGDCPTEEQFKIMVGEVVDDAFEYYIIKSHEETNKPCECP